MYLSTIMRSKVLAVVAVMPVMLGLITSCALEHPTKKETKEHPVGEEISGVTLEDVAQFAENYITENSEEGIFKYTDTTTGKLLELTFDKVHRDRLSQTKKDEYFVCVDFKGKDGNTYDLDFFVRGKNKDELEVVQESIAVHKVDGKENYTWKYNKKEGVWEKQTVKGEKEHPEHPQKEHPSY